MSRHEVSWTCLIEDRGQFISWDSVHGRRCTHLYYVKVLSMHEWLWMPKDVGFHMIPVDPVPHIHLPRTRQRWAAPPLCNEPSECWRPWPTPCPPHSRSPTASPDFWADFWPCPWWNNIRYQSPKMQGTGSLWFIYNHLQINPILWKYIKHSPNWSQICGNPSFYQAFWGVFNFGKGLQRTGPLHSWIFTLSP